MKRNRYTFNKAKFGTHQLIADEIGNGKKVLDVGCNKGYLSALSKNNSFYGIDNSEEDLAIAKQAGYKEIFDTDLNDCQTNLHLDKKFDVIIFADILEHLISPSKTLCFLTDNYLKKNGKVIISLPNVANFSIRTNLLLGNFNYTETGILDKTHLHLYTSKTAEKLIEDCNLKIIKRKFSSNNFGQIIKTFSFLGELLGFNLIFVCKKKH